MTKRRERDRAYLRQRDDGADVEFAELVNLGQDGLVAQTIFVRGASVGHVWILFPGLAHRE